MYCLSPSVSLRSMEILVAPHVKNGPATNAMSVMQRTRHEWPSRELLCVLAIVMRAAHVTPTPAPTPATTVAIHAGFTDCPCLSPASSTYNATRDGLAANGYNVTYGTEGCVAYDALFSASCQGGLDRPAWCDVEWCYIDETLCMMNEGACEENGHMLGERQHPNCRDRPRTASHVSGMGAVHYSYATCGNVNQYDDEFERPIVNTTLQVIAYEARPYVIKLAPRNAYDEVPCGGGR